MVNGHNEERLSVRLWRGYFTGLFYARPVDSDVALFTSPRFRTLRLSWARQRGLAERGRAALEELVEGLTASGWQMEGQQAAAPWYELEFFRPPIRTPRRARRKLPSVGATPRN